MEQQIIRTEIKHRKDIYLSEETGDQGEKNRAPDENQVDYQTDCVTYAIWLRAVFGFLGATTDEVGTADATALGGFTRIEVDPWLSTK